MRPGRVGQAVLVGRARLWKLHDFEARDARGIITPLCANPFDSFAKVSDITGCFTRHTESIDIQKRFGFWASEVPYVTPYYDTPWFPFKPHNAGEASGGIK